MFSWKRFHDDAPLDENASFTKKEKFVILAHVVVEIIAFSSIEIFRQSYV